MKRKQIKERITTLKKKMFVCFCYLRINLSVLRQKFKVHTKCIAIQYQVQANASQTS